MSLDYWLKKTRDDGIVREEDIEKAAASAHRAYMRGMSLKAAAARKAKKAKREQERQARFRRSM